MREFRSRGSVRGAVGKTGRGKLQVQPCLQCSVSDGRPEKGDLSRWANKRRSHSDRTYRPTSSHDVGAIDTRFLSLASADASSSL